MQWWQLKTKQSVQIIKKNLKEEICSKCRLRKQYEEAVENLISGCPTLAKNEYLMRHGRVGAYLHYSICKALGIKITGTWYTHTPKPVRDHEDVIVLLN